MKFQKENSMHVHFQSMSIGTTKNAQLRELQVIKYKLVLYKKMTPHFS